MALYEVAILEIPTDAQRKEGKQETIEADRVVLALGAKPITYLIDALEGNVPELHVIGDSTRPAKVIEAVYEGSRIARLI